MAILLVKCGLRVAVLERSRYEHFRIGETLPLSANRLLESIGVWEEFQRDVHLVSPGIVSQWHSSQISESRLDGTTAGWHLDRNHFDAMLTRRAREQGATIYVDAAIRQCTQMSPSGWSLVVESGSSILKLKARWCVDATGRADWFAQRCGAKRRVWDQLVSVIGFGTTTSDDSRTYLEAAPDGWWYAAKLPGSRFVAAWMTDATSLPRGRGELWGLWYERLKVTTLVQSVFAPTIDGGLKTRSANTAISSCVQGSNWIAIGDSAASYDPLSSAGICKALEDAHDASRAVLFDLQGFQSERRRYALKSEASFEQYLMNRRKYYSQVDRWPESPFWKRRRFIEMLHGE